MKVEINTNPERLKSLVIENKVFRSAYDYELTAEDVEQAQKDLSETEEVKNSSLRNLRQMLSRDELNYRTDDDYLLHYLRCKKFNCSEAYKMMHYVYSVNKEYPEVFATLPPNLETLLDSRRFNVLPYRDEGGSIILVDKFGQWKTSEASIYTLLQYFQPIADIFSMNPCCQINKVICIIDFKGMNLRQLAALSNPSTVMFLLKTVQNLYTCRVKYVFLINPTKLVYILLNAVRRLLKKKIADRIVIIDSDMKELHQYLHPAILPKEYGGTLEDSECSITQHIMNNLRYVEYAQSFRRPKKI